MTTLVDQVKISAIAIAPYVLALCIVLVPAYVIQKKPLLGAVWKDVVTVIASIIGYFGISLAYMQIPLDVEKY